MAYFGIRKCSIIGILLAHYVFLLGTFGIFVGLLLGRLVGEMELTKGTLLGSEAAEGGFGRIVH